MADTVRQRIMDNLVSRFQAIQSGVGGYDYQYSDVTSDPLGSNTYGNLCVGGVVAGIYDVAETKTQEFNCYVSQLTVVIEFHVKPFTNQSPAKQLRKILGEVQKIMYSDKQCGGNALNTVEVNNQLDIDSTNDKIIIGTITYRVTYRHSLLDPTTGF